VTGVMIALEHQGRGFAAFVKAVGHVIPLAEETGANLASVFALYAGVFSFGQIVKSAGPTLVAVISQFVYDKPVTKAEWLCLHVFAALRSIENKKLMETAGLTDRLGRVGNQFAGHVGQPHRVGPVVLRPHESFRRLN
jgi:ABC-type cobalamin transport system ATPase subunit